MATSTASAGPITNTSTTPPATSPTTFRFASCSMMQNRVMYMLQDANLNVVGLVAGPAPSTVTWQPVGTLLEQYVYEPYGKVAQERHLSRPPGQPRRPPGACSSSATTRSTPPKPRR